ncbi:hypothetical protein Tco_1150986, partial [Tanacetum coccineum]
RGWETTSGDGGAATGGGGAGARVKRGEIRVEREREGEREKGEDGVRAVRVVRKLFERTKDENLELGLQIESDARYEERKQKGEKNEQRKARGKLGKRGPGRSGKEEKENEGRSDIYHLHVYARLLPVMLKALWGTERDGGLVMLVRETEGREGCRMTRERESERERERRRFER